jgi:hypothetical protein
MGEVIELISSCRFREIKKKLTKENRLGSFKNNQKQPF